MKIQNKKILITGASSGIGYALAKELLKYNCTLFLLARRKERLDEIKQLSPGNVYTYCCDVSDREEVKEVFSGILAANEIDIAILNAGTGYRASIEDFDSRLADETFGVNILGMIYCVEQLLPQFKKRKSGIIAGVSSLADARGFPGSGFYCASKAAATIFLESIRVEIKKYNVKIITIKPGFVKTPMTDKNEFKMPFIMETDKAARIIIKGIKKEKRIIQFPLPVILGTKLIRCMPDFLYGLLSNKLK